jgi:SAM-dependent methyltransferase
MQMVRQGSGTILDYGCGRGEVIEAGRELGLNIYGTEVFYKGDKTKRYIEEKGLLGDLVREMENGQIPFPDVSFNLVVCNQVLEHVPELDTVLKDIHRVLKPGGHFLALFPAKEVIREGHIDIPFVHWFSSGSRFRLYYAAALRAVGLGYHKKVGKSPLEWARHYLSWIDKYTVYHDRATIFMSFNKYFSFRLIENEYIKFRLRSSGKNKLSRLFEVPIVDPIGCRLFRRLSGLVILAQKR